jgi:5-histidylcysteine sulfoxide synthase
MQTRNPNLDNLKDEVLSISLTQSRGWTSNLGVSSIDLSVPRNESWWTGKAPMAGVCPGVDDAGQIHSLAMPNLATCSRAETLAYFNNSWTLTEVLFSGLVGDEPFYRPPYHGLRHPLIFYYVHPACLYINKLRVAGLIDTPVDSFFETLFETGVDEMSWDDMSKNEIVWPPLDQAHAYRKKVYGIVEHLIVNHPGLADGHDQVTDKDPLWALFMSFEHERIHLETSSVLIRELPLSLVRRPPQFPAPARGADAYVGDVSKDGKLGFVSVAAGAVRIGKDRSHPTFGWDNEYGLREVSLEDFEVSTTLISNSQYLEFVRDGGYSETSHWTAEGLKWKLYRNVKWPTFWVPDGPQGLHKYQLRTIYDVIDMPADWPCVVNYHEAKAYSTWLAGKENQPGSYRLLTEAEHYRLRAGREAAIGEANLGLVCGSERSVHQSQLQVKDLFGNVWQWLEDDFYPLPGARVHPYYDDFSTPCYDGEHKMIVGGSFISTGDEASPYERFHFRPHFFQHAGFRLVRTRPLNKGQVVLIKKDALGKALPVSADLLGQSEQESEELAKQAQNQAVNLKVLADFGYLLSPPAVTASAAALALRNVVAPARVVASVVQKYAPEAKDVLDIGSSLGALAYELADQAQSVVAVELRGPLYERALLIQRDAQVAFEWSTADGATQHHVSLLDRARLEKISFRRADPVSLPAEFQNFAVVLLNDIITQVPSPGSLIGRLAGDRGLVAAGGLLVVLSDFVWGAACEESLRIGGRLDAAGQFQESGLALERELADAFDLVEKQNLPYVELLGNGKALLGEKQLLVFDRR